MSRSTRSTSATRESVHAFAVHPGGILTPLQRHVAHGVMVGYGWIDEAGNPAERF